MSHDTWIHRVIRGIVRPLAGTPVTPNHLTTVRLVTGLGAAAGFATGNQVWITIGAGLFLISMLFDRADGELARLSGKSSRFGHFYDIISDAVCDSLVLTGVGFGLRDGGFGAWAIPMGTAAGVSVAWTFYMIMQVERREGEGRASFAGVSGFDPDDVMVVIPIAMVAGFGDALLLAAVVAAPSAALAVHLNLRRRSRANAFGNEQPKSD